MRRVWPLGALLGLLASAGCDTGDQVAATVRPLGFDAGMQNAGSGPGQNGTAGVMPGGQAPGQMTAAGTNAGNVAACDPALVNFFLYLNEIVNFNGCTARLAEDDQRVQWLQVFSDLARAFAPAVDAGPGEARGLTDCDFFLPAVQSTEDPTLWTLCERSCAAADAWLRQNSALAFCGDGGVPIPGGQL